MVENGTPDFIKAIMTYIDRHMSIFWNYKTVISKIEQQIQYEKFLKYVID